MTDPEDSGISDSSIELSLFDWERDHSDENTHSDDCDYDD